MFSPQYHLNGAFSLISAIKVDFSSWELAQAGFWNYLREEITVGLVSRRCVQISIPSSRLRAVIACPNLTDDMQANAITYLLACIMNIYFPVHYPEDRHTNDNSIDDQLPEWTILQNDLATWRKGLPSSFEPYSKAPITGNMFPWYVSALQYSSIAEILLTLSSLHFQSDRRLALERVQELALHVCSPAFTNDSEAARVNAFGPLSFCGRFLTHDDHRKALEAMLNNFSRPTAWPINSVISDLKDCWTRDLY